MKKLFYILCVALAVVSCEIIPENDRIEKVPQVESSQRVLLTEFTGYKCVNCPDAAEVAHTLLESYPENVVVVAMHPEGNSFTDPGTDTDNNYRCPAAQTYYAAFGGTTVTPFPKGVINWKKMNGMYMNDYMLWTAAVTKEMKEEKGYGVSIKSVGDAETQSTSITVTVNHLGGDITNPNLVLLITEDHIIGKQASKNGEIEEYEHNHVLRTTITDVWGDALTLEDGATVEKQYAFGGFEDNGWLMNNCNIVAVLIDPNTKEVLNCAEVPVIDETLTTVEFTLKDINGDTIHNGDTLRVKEQYIPGQSKQLAIHGSVECSEAISVSVECGENAIFENQSFCSGMMCVPAREEYSLSPGTWYADYMADEKKNYVINYTFHDGTYTNVKKITCIFESTDLTVDFTLKDAEGKIINDGDTLIVKEKYVPGQSKTLTIKGNLETDATIVVDAECEENTNIENLKFCNEQASADKKVFGTQKNEWNTEYETSEEGRYIVHYTFHDGTNTNVTKITCIFEYLSEE